MKRITSIQKQVETLVQCPYCQGRFQARTAYSVSCDCDEFPIIEGILYLKKHRKLYKQALILLANGYIKNATRLLLDSRRIANLFAASSLSIPLQLHLGALNIIYGWKDGWWRYLRVRSKRVTFINALATLSIISKKKVVADLACGAGHFLQAIQNQTSVETLIGVDVSFYLLILARKYYCNPSTLLVCADLEHGLPFCKNVLDVLYMNDSFMYIHKKKYLLQELSRVTPHYIFLNHVHNQGHNNAGQGEGITPKQLKTLTRTRFSTYMLPDKTLYHQIIQGKIKYDRQETNMQYSSYSYMLVSNNTLLAPINIPPSLIQFIQNIHVDFTEDEYIK